jgi:hypothetical protein
MSKVKLKVVKPTKPDPYSRYNWRTREDYEQAVRIYELAMGIYLAAGGTA